MHHEHGHYHGDVYHPHEHHDDDHEHSHDSKRTALLLILGSSPMVEGVPAFFAAGKYGITLIIPMAILFALSTIGTYVILCVYSQAGLKHVEFALIGFVFLVWPVV
jgi:hypothetical protein